MHVKIWQSPNSEFMFSDAERMEKRGHSLNQLPSQEYSCVYDGNLWAFCCEDVYRALNERTKPEGYTGRSLSAGDIVEITENKVIEPSGNEDATGLYFCDSIGFKPCAWA